MAPQILSSKSYPSQSLHAHTDREPSPSPLPGSAGGLEEDSHGAGDNQSSGEAEALTCLGIVSRLDRGPVHLELKFSIESASPFSSGSQSVYFARPGDRLKGTCRISTVLALHDSWVEVSLQGLESILTYSVNASPQQSHREEFSPDRFLYLRHRFKLDGDCAVEDNRKIYVFPFLFVIPPGVDRTSDRAENRCKPLPPSFRIPHTTFSTWSPISLPAASIKYALGASVTYSPSADATSDFAKSAEIFQPITCLPYIEIQPPIETKCFPDEYVLSATQDLWRSVFGRKLGHITITTLEPRPLVYDSEHLSATECTFHMTVESSLANLQRLRTVSVEVDPVLQLKSYYSRTRLAGIPHKDSVHERGPIRLHSDAVPLQKHTISCLEWKPGAEQVDWQRYSDAETEFSGEIPTNSTTTQSLGGSEGLRGQTNPHSSATAEDAVSWHAIVNVPMEPPFRLQPSFCSEHVAAAYAILTKISLGGVYAKPSYLVSPLQVAYPCAVRPLSGTLDTDIEVHNALPPYRER